MVRFKPQTPDPESSALTVRPLGIPHLYTILSQMKIHKNFKVTKPIYI